ncbi:MAG: hypothetical protein MJ175_02765 [Clostridia bacterium]|nr:hypothetical protein [Clostridia bacterium]
MKKQYLAGMMLAAMAVSALASCGDSEPTVNTPSGTTPVTQAVTEAAETEETIKSLLPSDLDFGGETIRIMNCMYFEKDRFMLETESETGDVVNDAIFRRNSNVQGNLNVNFTFEDYVETNSQSGDAVLKKSVMAGGDDYDLVFGVQYKIVQQVVSNIFLDLNNTKYLHLDQPWWYQFMNKELTIGSGKAFFATGDITLGVLRNMSCMYVNKDMYKKHFESVDDLYKEVLDGKWTFDRMSEYCTGMYQDINGDGKMDEEDQYGIGVIAANLTDHFTYDAGIRVTTRDANNIPQLTMNNEKTANFTQKLYSLYYENPGTHVFPPDYNSLDIVMPNKFNNGTLMFLPGWFYTSEQLRDMEVDYGVIPFPKYDENQETYLSLAHDIGTLTCVPSTCSKADDVSAVMEAMAFEGYRDVLPAYYEIAIKIKYSRDDTNEAMQILDIIHDNATTDFAFIYNYALSGIGLIERDLMGGKKSDFASAYTKKEKSVQKQLDKLLAAFEELE